MNSLNLAHGQVPLPCFLPDGTKGVVRTVDSRDLEDIGIPALMMNGFHLSSTPGSTTIKALGGLHKMTGWRKPIITDSGGFQAFSMIRGDKGSGSISNKGLVFDLKNRRYQLTPEKAIQKQISYGADVIYCLDDCTHPDDSDEVQEASVARTILWAKRCKEEYRHQIEGNKRFADSPKPLIFGVVQGGRNPDLRRRCAEALLEIGFDGYGYGGYPVDQDGNLVEDMFRHTRSLIPRTYELHALGLGHPRLIRKAHAMGYNIFDSAMPTRDARRGRLYIMAEEQDAESDDWFDYLYIDDDKFIKSDEPLCAATGGWVNERYSRGYLHHLFAVNESVGQRLATIHNLTFMKRLMESLHA